MDLPDEALAVDEIKKATATRGTIYRFLSKGFSSEVDEPFLEWLVKVQPAIARLAESSDDEDFVKGSGLLGEFARDVEANYEKDKSGFLVRLAIEYAALFLNVGKKPVHLFESVFLGKDHLLYEEPYFDVVRIYKIYGFKKRGSFKEPDDHVAIELEFMAHLCDFAVKSIDDKRADYAAGYLGNQEEFLEDHLGKWASLLGDKLKASTKNDFYLSLAYLLKGFVSSDMLLVPQLQKDLSGSPGETHKRKGHAA